MVILEHNGYSVMRIEPDMVEDTANLIAPLLQKSIPYTENYATIPDLLSSLEAGVRPWQFWVIAHEGELKGAFITTLEQCGRERLFNFEIIAGVDAAEWIYPLVERFEQYMAKIFDCTGARIIGRKGWEKFMGRMGYHASHFITSKKLCEAPERLEGWAYMDGKEGLNQLPYDPVLGGYIARQGEENEGVPTDDIMEYTVNEVEEAPASTADHIQH